jgi:recombination protein RecA
MIEATMTEESKQTLKDKRNILAKFTTSYKRKHGDDRVVMGFGDQLDLDYGYVKAPVEPLSTLLSRPGAHAGGFPLGRYTIIGGPERAGKSTLCWQVIAQDQLTDPDSVWCIAAPEPLDEDYMEMLGVDMERVFVIKDGLMEDVMQKIIDLAKLKVIKGFVVDSIGALTPRAEVQDSKGKEHELEHTGMLDLQRKMGQFFRMSNNWVSRSNAACILISHVYQDPNNNGRYVVKGGNAVKHWAHVRLKLTRIQDLSTVEEIIMPDGVKRKSQTGHDVVITLEKSKQNGNEGKSVVVPYRFGIGLDAIESSIAMGINLGIIERAGAWYSFTHEDKEHRQQGRNKVSQFFKANEELYNELVYRLQKHLEASWKPQTPEENSNE